MEEPRRTPRYRGYRPPPLWWFKLKYLGGMLVFGLFMAFASDQVILALLTGKLPTSRTRRISFSFGRTDRGGSPGTCFYGSPWTCCRSAASFYYFQSGKVSVALRPKRGSRMGRIWVESIR